MAIIGVSKPYVAKYSNTDTTVSYTSGQILDKMTEIDISINSAEDNNFYADNSIAESDSSFSGGSVTVNTADLGPEATALVLGITPVPIADISGVTDEDVNELIFDDDQRSPYLGFGCIIKKRVNNVDQWRAIILTKIMFAVPNDAATTQGETIEWQTPQLTGTIMRDDSAKHAWKREATFTTEAQAEAYIKARLSITK